MDIQSKIAIIQCYYESNKSATSAIRLFKNRHNIHNDPFNSSTVIRIADEKPKDVITRSLHPAKVCVWIGFTSRFMLDPIIIDQGTINGTKYYNMLNDQIIPNLKRIRKCSSTIFMQDGAPPHICCSVKQLLTKTFTKDRIISRHFPQPWPPRSPDINPCDYYFWSHMKTKVYSPHLPNTIEELKARIIIAAKEINESGCLKLAILNLLDRLHLLIENEGRHIEQCL